MGVSGKTVDYQSEGLGTCEEMCWRTDVRPGRVFIATILCLEAPPDRPSHTGRRSNDCSSMPLNHDM